jgi:methionyl-tRNA formyltransferase
MTMVSPEGRYWFLGSGLFAATCFSALAAEMRFARVVTAPPRPAGRGLHLRPVPLDEAARQAGYEPEYSEKLSREERFLKVLEEERPDALLVVDFGQLILPPFLDLPRFGCCNIHPSLLPAYRGAAPLQRALLDGVAETGVTVFRLVREMDAGPILAQERYAVAPEDDAVDLLRVLALKGSQMLLRVLQLLQQGHTLEKSQDSRLATIAPKITKEEARVEWAAPAFAVHNRVRALALAPGAFAFLGGKRVKLWRSRPAEGKGRPGAVLRLGERGPIVACGDGAVELLEVQPEGKPRCGALAWVRGLRENGGIFFE